MRPPCQHCRLYPANRPWSLCWTCYYQPGIRERYPSTSKFAVHGVCDGHFIAPLPEPTHYLPGTPEKQAVLEERARRREQLFHPRDAADPDGELGVPIRQPDPRTKPTVLPRDYQPVRYIYPRPGGRWLAHAWRGGRRVHVGMFDSQAEAVEAARRARAG